METDSLRYRKFSDFHASSKPNLFIIGLGKSEIRNPKQIQNSKFKYSKHCFEFWTFGFNYCLGVTRAIARFIALIAFFSFHSLAFSATGSIAGKVVDKTTREPLAGANIIVMDTQLGAAADVNGDFIVRNIESGSYNIEISMLGYKTLIKNRVVVKPGKSIFLQVELGQEPIQMSGIVVTPTFFEKTKDAVVSSRRMDFEEIITQPGGCYDVQRAVQALPAVVSGADQDNEIIVRGGNYGENLFVIDNIEIPNPNHFAWQGTGGGPINIINTDFVRQIDFMAGAFPAKYGNKASSVMDIKLRQGARDGLHAKFNIGMAGIGGSIEGPIKNGSFLVSAHRSYLSLIKSSFGMTAVPHYYNIQGKFTYDLSPKHKLNTLGIYANDWIYIEDETTRPQMASDITIDAKSYQYTFGGSLVSLFKRGYSSFTLSRTLNYWNHYVTDTSEAQVYHNYATEVENTAKIDMVLRPFAKNEISLGVYLKNPEYDYDTWAKPETLFIYDPETGAIIDTTDYIYGLDVKKRESSWKHGGYVQYRNNLGRILTFTLGLRYDRFEYTGNAYFCPRAGVSIHLTKNTDFNLAYGKHSQTPDWYQLALDTANHYLKNKYTDQYVVGLEHLFAEDVKGTVEGYYKKYQDVPIQRAYTTSDPNDWDHVYVNKGEGYAKGIEFFLQKKVKQNLWGTLSYSYSIARMEDPRDSTIEFSWDFDYQHVFTLISGYRQEFKGLGWFENLKRKWWYNIISIIPIVPGDETECSFRWRYIGGKPYTSQTWHPEWKRWTLDEDQPINSTRMDAYKRFDLHIKRRWFFGKWSLMSYLEVENLFNTPNIWDYQYLDTGEIETVYQYGRMIIGGVVVEF